MQENKQGKLYLVSVGPGSAELIPPLAKQALSESEVIVAYALYLQWVQPWIAGKEIHTPPLTQERARAVLAIEQARAGRVVSLVSSGDIGIYAMAALAFEEMREDDTFDVQVVPGISSANACASLLGSPLSHDFATLSLSDLLCPWAWIETRARHIAQADLAVVFYNVQSQQRQEGVYRILDIMLAHKSPDTVCAIVRNAYREDQKVEIISLAELRGRRFDMLTSIVIGNRFTRRKRDWMFTPRGYHTWDETADPAPVLQDDAVWVFSGTQDGNALAAQLATECAVQVSAASDYGAQQFSAYAPNIPVVSGQVGMERRRAWLQQHRARAIIDATHPYAATMSQQLIELADGLGLPYLRFERPVSAAPSEALHVADAEAAATLARRLNKKRIFLATGSKDLETFAAHADDDTHWFARLAPDTSGLQRAIDLGWPRQRLCVMQGPFSARFNAALWADWEIDCVITKQSGAVGGFPEKVAAAQALGITLIVIDRPHVAYPQHTSDPQAVLDFVQALPRTHQNTLTEDSHE